MERSACIQPEIVVLHLFIITEPISVPTPTHKAKTMFSIVPRSSLRNVSAAGTVARAGTARLQSTRLYSTMHDNDPEVLEREKRRTLSGEHRKTPHMDGVPGWNEHLASSAEASVKADKYATGSVDEMQRKTVDYVHTRHSPDERLGGREATYQRDEVSGPLSGTAYTGDEVPVNHGKVLKKKTVREETTEVLEEEGSPTASEANLRADREDFKF
ncbi:hypothetical protein PILCRDRAFT_818404 [Piloderma croceum F 1598]|uniref:Uncharacterized protein n=1 Tax=Piloderma croceum (strain F 1598) TaxID=765440 RepID=A0A0C3C3F4_PILCF|nr:hypothetical protein PILCRDRAFT_818404 [Piloderma croceum F 1598]